MSEAERRVLHAGCGSKGRAELPPPMQGECWREIRLDIDPAARPDIVADITDMGAVPDGSVDAVYSSHTLEHLPAHEVPRAIAEFARVLAPGHGFAVVTCPDLQALGRVIAEGRIEEPLYHAPAGPVAAIDMLYGLRSAIARGNAHMAHRTGFTARTLASILGGNGFASAFAVRRRAGLALWAIGFRRRVSEAERAAHRDAYLPPP
jgi:SAM-dependent methyltransferase